MEHVEAAVAAEGVDLPLVADGQLHAQGAGDLVAHGGVAVLHVVGILGTGTPHALHIAGQGAGGADGHVIVSHHGVNGAQNGGLAQAGVQVLGKTLGGVGVGVVDDGLPGLLVLEDDVVQTLQLLDPLLLGGGDLRGVGGLVAIQLGEQAGQGVLGVGHHGDGLHLQGLELGDIDVDKLAGILEQPLGGGGEIGVAGADADDQVRLLGDVVGSGAAGNADAAQVQGMGPLNGALARLGLGEGNAGGLGESTELGVSLGVADTAAADQHGTLSLLDGLGGVVQSGLGGGAALQTPHALFEEALGIVIGLALHVLGHGDADGAGVGGVGQHPEGGDHGAHQLLGADDPVPVAADGLEGVVGGDGQVVGLLHLLQHGVGLAAGIHVAGQHQQGDIVGGGGAAGGDHIGGAGAHRGRGHADLLALHLLGEGHGGLGHALLVLAVPDLQVLGLLGQRLAEAHHVAVAGNDKHAADEAVLHAVHLDELVLQETDQGLRHGQTNGFHVGRYLLNFISPDRCAHWRRASTATRAPHRRCGSSARDRPPGAGCPRHSTWRSRARRSGSGSRG